MRKLGRCRLPNPCFLWQPLSRALFGGIVCGYTPRHGSPPVCFFSSGSFTITADTEGKQEDSGVPRGLQVTGDTVVVAGVTSSHETAERGNADLTEKQNRNKAFVALDYKHISVLHNTC